MQGLREVKRVVKKGGCVILLEHGRTKHTFVNHILDLFDPLVASLMGPHINRDTVDNVQRAGLKIVTALNLDTWGIFKLIVGRV